MPAGSELPTGTVTFLFTDIEGSTRLIQELGPRYPELLAHHREVIETAVSAAGGHVFGAEGDALFVAFADATSAVAAAVAAQRGLAEHEWPDGRTLRVRMGIHTGEAIVVGGDYVGLPLHKVARIAAAGHGGQTLLSSSTESLVGHALPADVELRDLGTHRLRDLADPDRLYQLVIEGQPNTFPPLRTVEGQRNNLPVQVTSFVGREEIDAARQLLASSRLLTLTGPGGTGKTRLALQLAAEVMDEYPDGVLFVPLDALSDPALVPSAIVAALQLNVGSDPPLDRVIVHLRERKMLLLLDNFEQVVDAAPDVSRLLREVPGVRVIVTSRVVLHAYGEQEFPVPALRLPPTSRAVTADEAARSEAVRLFVERAMAAQPTFRLTDRNAPAVAEIVTRLDGLPLAIELAAARVKLLPVEALRSRLDQRLSLLVAGPRDRPERQQTLRGAIDWSYDLLDEPDRRTFQRFGEFAGGAGLDQAEAVCGPREEIGRDPLDALASLGDKSLLRSDADPLGEARFSMLATIREYALERLDEAPEAEAIRRRHAEAFVALAEEYSDHLLGPQGRPRLDRLELENDNLRSAVDWAVARGEAQIAMRLGWALWRFWQRRGHILEATERLAAILAMPGSERVPPLLRSRVHRAAGSIAYWRADWDTATREYRLGFEQAELSDDKQALADALYDRAFAPDRDLESNEERMNAGRVFLERALALYRELGDVHGQAGALWALSVAEITSSDWVNGRAHAEECLRLYRTTDDAFGTGWALHMLGLLEAVQHNLEAAERYFRESFAIFIEADDMSAYAIMLADFSELARMRDDYLLAYRYAAAARRVQEETGVDIVLNQIESLGWQLLEKPDGDPEALASWEAGAQLTLEQATAEVLGAGVA